MVYSIHNNAFVINYKIVIFYIYRFASGDLKPQLIGAWIIRVLNIGIKDEYMQGQNLCYNYGGGGKNVCLILIKNLFGFTKIENETIILYLPKLVSNIIIVIVSGISKFIIPTIFK